MLKILVADSDVELLKNIAEHIKVTFAAVDVKLQNNSSIKLIKMIKDYSPGLIFLNIRFFGLESIKIVRDVYESYPGIKIVIFGTYSDNEYIQKTMQYGIFDYIYKPVKLSEISRCIQNALDFFKTKEEKDAKNAKILKNYELQRSQFENIFTRSLFKGRINNDSEIVASFRYFNIDLAPDFTAFVLRIDHYKTILLTLDDKEKHLMIFKIFTVMTQELKGKKFKLYINKFNAINAILGNMSDLKEIMKVCTKIKESVYHELNIRVTIGIGRTYKLPSQIALSYREADACLRYRFYLGYNSVIPIQFAEPYNQITYSYPRNKENLLVYAAVIGEYETCIDLLQDIFQSLRLCEPLPEKCLPKIIMDLLISINRYASELRLNIEGHFTTFFSSKDALELKDLDSAYQYMANALKNFCDYIVTLRSEADGKLVDRCKELLTQSYHESFSMSALAMELDTTPEYLERIFQINENESPYDFMSKLRIQEAKGLMHKTSLNDILIAIQIGYGDVKYYKSIFRKYEGMTVHEYRIKNNLYDVKLEEI